MQFPFDPDASGQNPFMSMPSCLANGYTGKKVKKKEKYDC
jgi:hypothetical protein